jgi:hypothetical protein
MADVRSATANWFSFGWLAPTVALVNAVVLIAVIRYLNPSTLSFLTEEIDRVTPFIALALVISLFGNVVRLWFSPSWFVSLADVLATSAGLAATVRLFQVSPFVFDDGPIPWTVVLRVLLIAAMVGSVFGIVLSTGRLLSIRATAEPMPDLSRRMLDKVQGPLDKVTEMSYEVTVRSIVTFIGRQVVLITLAILAYFGVRGVTEGGFIEAHSNAARVLRLEKLMGIDIELELQGLIADHDWVVTVANWIYIWGHWPVVIATLTWLAVRHRPDFYELRNALFISGGIGLLIFVSFAVAPPRLFAAEYMDTVTMRSESYRVLQPPGLVNKYAAVPSLHFGWNLLVGVIWAKRSKHTITMVAALLMPMAMAFAVVATANHWVLDIIVGGLVALTGLSIERLRRSRSGEPGVADLTTEGPDGVEESSDGGGAAVGEDHLHAGAGHMGSEPQTGHQQGDGGRDRSQHRLDQQKRGRRMVEQDPQRDSEIHCAGKTPPQGNVGHELSQARV